jgi:hypothetical protein
MRELLEILFGGINTNYTRWSAVVRGALKRSMIKKRKIRGAYGVKCERKWNARHEPGGIYARDVQPEFK